MQGSIFPFHILAANRTPLGSFGGLLRDVPAPRLGALALRSALVASGEAVSAIQEIVQACAFPNGLAPNPGATAAREADIAGEAWTLNRGPLSGLAAISQACRGLGPQGLAMAGGFESLSGVPYLLPAARWGRRMGETDLLDPLLLEGSSPLPSAGMPLPPPTAMEIPTRRGFQKMDADDPLGEADFWADGAASLVLAKSERPLQREPWARLDSIIFGTTPHDALEKLERRSGTPIDRVLLSGKADLHRPGIQHLTHLPPGPSGVLLLMALREGLRAQGLRRGAVIQLAPDSTALAVLLELP